MSRFLGGNYTLLKKGTSERNLCAFKFIFKKLEVYDERIKSVLTCVKNLLRAKRKNPRIIYLAENPRTRHTATPTQAFEVKNLEFHPCPTDENPRTKITPCFFKKVPLFLSAIVATKPLTLIIFTSVVSGDADLKHRKNLSPNS